MPTQEEKQWYMRRNAEMLREADPKQLRVIWCFLSGYLGQDGQA